MLITLHRIKCTQSRSVSHVSSFVQSLTTSTSRQHVQLFNSDSYVSCMAQSLNQRHWEQPLHSMQSRQTATTRALHSQETSYVGNISLHQMHLFNQQCQWFIQSLITSTSLLQLLSIGTATSIASHGHLSSPDQVVLCVVAVIPVTVTLLQIRDEQYPLQANSQQGYGRAHFD